MLIIFDLDDTLIQTSASVTPLKFKSALARMIKEGCSIELEESFAELMRINEKAAGSKEAFEVFTNRLEIEKKYLQIALNEVYHTSLEGIAIPPSKGAIKILTELKKENHLALVSMGKFDRQMNKMEKAGIDSPLFYKISILEEGSKRGAYQKLIENLSISPSEVLVIGDRIQVDLAPAKELGCTTVHMKQGRGVHSQGSEGVVDFTITDLSQIMGIYLKLRQSVN